MAEGQRFLSLGDWTSSLQKLQVTYVLSTRYEMRLWCQSS